MVIAFLEWMRWTTPTALFAVFVFSSIAGLVTLAFVHPPVPRKGFLPMETSGGDRLFAGLLGIGLIMILWIRFTDLMLPIGLLLGLVWLAVVLLKG